MIIRIEIKDHGEFDVRHDYLHRGVRPRLVLEGQKPKTRFKEVQYDTHYIEYEYQETFQRGYDYEGNEIWIKVLDKT